MKKRILFIVNPIAGIGRKDDLDEMIQEEIDTSIFEWHTEFTRYAGHAAELATQAVGDYHIVAACGGDGTVNEICQPLVGSDVLLALVPGGSGNGLVRHLNIPLDLRKALKIIDLCRVKTIDTVQVNERIFVNMAGIGFDGLVARRFADFGRRGFYPYALIATTELVHYQPLEYEISYNNRTFNEKAFMVNMANSTQFGFNAYVAPAARIDDGLLDVVILRPFPLHAAPDLLFRLFSKTWDYSDYNTMFKTSEITIRHEQPLVAHIDGEPVELGSEARFRVLPASLKVIC